MSGRSREAIIQVLETDIDDGNSTDAFLCHLAEAVLTRAEVIVYISKMAHAAALRKRGEARIVAESVRGIEDLAGTADFERRSATNLLELAALLKG